MRAHAPPKRGEMPANSEVLKMLLDEDKAGSGVAAMSELQEDRNAQSNCRVQQQQRSLGAVLLSPPKTHPTTLLSTGRHIQMVKASH